MCAVHVNLPWFYRRQAAKAATSVARREDTATATTLRPTTAAVAAAELNTSTLIDDLMTAADTATTVDGLEPSSGPVFPAPEPPAAAADQLDADADQQQLNAIEQVRAACSRSKTVASGCGGIYENSF